MRVQFLKAILPVLAVVMLSSCATTTDTTESSTKTFEKTTDASVDLSSSTSPGSSNTDSAGIERFTTSHYAAVKTEMAAGGGEYLGALAALLAVAPDKEENFFAITRIHFAELYPTDDTEPREMLATLNVLMQENPGLVN